MRIMAGTKELDDNDDDAAYMEANWKTVTAMGVLKTISTLVMSVEGSKEVGNLAGKLRLVCLIIAAPTVAFAIGGHCRTNDRLRASEQPRR